MLITLFLVRSLILTSQINPTKTVWKYQPRQINWNANSVATLIDLTEAKSEPPLTLKLTNKEVEKLIERPLEIPHYECISQYVERGVKATTEAVSSTAGKDRQDPLTMNKTAARKKIPNIKHKKYFKP